MEEDEDDGKEKELALEHGEKTSDQADNQAADQAFVGLTSC